MEYKDIETLYVLCGGGLTAVEYSLGILYTLYKTNNLFDENNKLKKINFCCTSGGCIPTLLLNYVYVNKLHITDDNWFEKYIITPCKNAEALTMIDLYIKNTIKGYLIYYDYSGCFVKKIQDSLYNMFKRIVPKKIYKGKRINFSNNNNFNYNYVIDNNIDLPQFSNDFTDLNEYSTLQQIVEVVCRTTIFANMSYIKTGFTNDAGEVIDNAILNIEQYTNLKTINYYSLNAYDEKTNMLSIKPYTLNYYFNRIPTLQIYNYMSDIFEYCKKNNIKMNKIYIPNKFNPVEKFNNPLYTNLVRKINMPDDFQNLGRFIGFYFENMSSDVRDIVFLYGAFETLYLINKSNGTKLTEKDLKFNSYYKDKIKNCEKIYFRF